MLKIYNTKNSQEKPSIVILIYGDGGTGKTTFASTAPSPILADCENGAKYFGLRGIEVDVAQIQQWADMKEFLELAKNDKYKTVVLDPIGELMEKLKINISSSLQRKWVQQDGSLTIAGWGELKDRMRSYIKVLRDLGKHIIIIAHIEEKDDEGRLMKRPKMLTKLSEELVNLVDIVAYMTTISDNEGKTKRVLLVDPTSDKFTAKDRTGQLGGIIPPNFQDIVKACQGTEKFKWSSEKAVGVEIKKEEKKPEEKKEDTEMKKIEEQDKEIEFEKNDSLFAETKLLIISIEKEEHKKQAISKAIDSNQFSSEQIEKLQKLGKQYEK